MNEMTATGGLPAHHGVERAAARIHRSQYPNKAWADLQDGTRYQYRGVVGHLLRDLGPAPAELSIIPLLWYSPSWGVLQAERRDWTSGDHRVVPVGAGLHDIRMELPDDAYPMTPIKPCKPGKSMDDIRRHVEPPKQSAEERAAA